MQELFVRPPVENGQITEIGHLKGDIVPELDQLIDYTYQLILANKEDLAAVYRLWEIRLDLLLFTNNLNTAKREAVNLNNYVETMADATITTPFSLKLLILRLKSAPNLNLINEYYKTLYVNEGVLTATQKLQLVYGIISVLIVKKEFLTLYNFNNSIIAESTSGDDLKSNLRLVNVLVSLIISATRDVTEHERSLPKLLMNDVIKTSLDDLVYSLLNVSPILDSDSTPLTERDIGTDITVELLADLIKLNKLTGRILCCLCGLWELKLTHKFIIVDNALSSQSNHDRDAEEGQSDIDKLYELIESKWCNYITKVYGLE